MAISIDTDLVMDVLKAGHADQIAAAREKLQVKRLSDIEKPLEVASSNAEFAAELLETELAKKTIGASQLRDNMQVDLNKNAFEKFEAVVLEQFVKYMLPEDSEVIFGEGTAGNIWKGMMAQQLGATIAKAGGIGIAEQMMATSYAPKSEQASNFILSQERDLIESLDDSAEGTSTSHKEN